MDPAVCLLKSTAPFANITCLKQDLTRIQVGSPPNLIAKLSPVHTPNAVKVKQHSIFQKSNLGVNPQSIISPQAMSYAEPRKGPKSPEISGPRCLKARGLSQPGPLAWPAPRLSPGLRLQHSRAERSATLRERQTMMLETVMLAGMARNGRARAKRYAHQHAQRRSPAIVGLQQTAYP